MWQQVTNVDLDICESCLSLTFFLILGRLQHIYLLLFHGARGTPQGSCGNLICGMRNAWVRV